MKKMNGCVVKNGTIELTKAFAKNAYTPGTAEFRHLAELHKAFPDFKITMRTATPKKDKEKHTDLTICYMGERKAIFHFEEYSLAKHAHFQDKQKFRTGMNTQE